MGNIISVATDKKMYTKIEQGKSYMASKNYFISKRKNLTYFLKWEPVQCIGNVSNKKLNTFMFTVIFLLFIDKYIGLLLSY
jgi:hypothetical protein